MWCTGAFWEEDWSFRGGREEGSTGNPFRGRCEDNCWNRLNSTWCGLFMVQKKHTDNSNDMSGNFQSEMWKTNSDCEQGCLVMMWRFNFLIMKGYMGQWGTYRNTKTKAPFFTNKGERNWNCWYLFFYYCVTFYFCVTCKLWQGQGARWHLLGFSSFNDLFLEHCFMVLKIKLRCKKRRRMRPGAWWAMD